MEQRNDPRYPGNPELPAQVGNYFGALLVSAADVEAVLDDRSSSATRRFGGRGLEAAGSLGYQCLRLKGDDMPILGEATAAMADLPEQQFELISAVAVVPLLLPLTTSEISSLVPNVREFRGRDKHDEHRVELDRRWNAWLEAQGAARPDMLSTPPLLATACGRLIRVLEPLLGWSAG
jgi:hypothetical protein